MSIDDLMAVAEAPTDVVGVVPDAEARRAAALIEPYDGGKEVALEDREAAKACEESEVSEASHSDEDLPSLSSLPSQPMNSVPVVARDPVLPPAVPVVWATSEPASCVAAFRGLAGEYAKVAAQHTEADPHGVLVAYLTFFGSVIGRRAFCDLANTKQHANLFAVLVGRTGVGRKGTATSAVSALFDVRVKRWSKRCKRRGLSTGEGLIHAVRDDAVHTTLKTVNGRRHEVQRIDPGVRDKRALFVESEFGRTLGKVRQPNSTLGRVMQDLWDGQDLSVTTSSRPTTATAPHGSIFGNITKEELLKRLDAIDIDSGFGNRILWAWVKRGPLIPQGGSIPRTEIESYARRTVMALRRSRQLREVRMDAAATERWRVEYERLARPRPGLYGQLTCRADSQIWRLGLLYAVQDGSPVIGLDHLEAALDLWRYCEASVRHVFGTRLANSKAELLYERMSEIGTWASREQLRRVVFSGHVSAARLDELLEYLHESGLIEERAMPSGGRPRREVRALPWPSTASNAQ